MTAFIKGSYPVTIAIAEDHPIFRNALASALKRNKKIKLVGTAANGKELVQLVSRAKPQVVVTDIRMPVMNGIEATREILQLQPHTYIIALSAHDDDTTVADVLHAGAKGFFLKDAPITAIINAILNTPVKKFQYCNTIANKLLQPVRDSDFHPTKPHCNPRLSAREQTIMQYSCRGLSAKEIAVEMKIDVRSVESARERIRKKTNTYNVAGLIVYTIKHGLFSNEWIKLVVLAVFNLVEVNACDLMELM